jgi:sigma-B regulation protein RsbU (phosphoserine phosphatase)
VNAAPSGAAFAVLAADVSGKGIAASLIMASCKAVIPFLARSGDPARVLAALNEKLCLELQRREFVAMVYVQLHANGTVQIANAGMPEPLLIGKDGSWRALSCDGDRFPLGVRATSNYRLSSHALTDGDRLLLFSDGLPEAIIDGEPLGYERVEKIAAENRGAAAIIDAVSAIGGVSIEDDVTAVMISSSTR